MSIQQALQYLASGGAVVLGAAFVSWLAENVPAFGTLTPAAKQAIMVVACLVLSLGAWAIQKYVPAATLEDLAAPFGIVMATLAALLGNQAWHQLINKANPEPPPAVTIAMPAAPVTPKPY